MIITVTFNPALDYVMRLDKIDIGQTNRSKSEEVQLGGKGINVSYVLGELGEETLALGFVAGFVGEEIVALAKENNIPTDFVQLKSGNSRINVKIKSEKETEINAGGPEISGDALAELKAKFAVLKKDDILVLSGSIPNSLPATIYQEIIAELSGAGVHVVCDATGKLLLNVLPFHPFLVKPNKAELAELWKREVKTEADVIEGAKYLQSLGGKNVLVSLGKEGALLLDENGEIHKAGNAEGKVQNTVGAGDSMVAGFVSGYYQTNDYKEALVLGSCCGNATALSPELATKAEIDSLREEISASYQKL